MCPNDPLGRTASPANDGASRCTNALLIATPAVENVLDAILRIPAASPAITPAQRLLKRIRTNRATLLAGCKMLDHVAIT